MRFSLWALLISLVSPPANALTGEELLKQCSAAAYSVEWKQCESYIAGVVSGISTLTTSMRILHPESSSYPQLYCVPRYTATAELVAATADYLLHHLDTQHYEASSEVLLALQRAYPCKGL